MLSQIIRFCSTGLLNTLVDFAAFNLLIWLTGASSTPAIAAINTIAIALAMANSYYFNRYWTFRAPNPKSHQELRRFLAASLAGIIINNLTLVFTAQLVSQIAWSTFILLNAGKILGAIFSSTWNFISYRNWVFRVSEIHVDSTTQQPPMIPGLFSLVIPAYNEKNRLPRRLIDLASTLPPYFPIEIIVVDDGSEDNTLELAQNISLQYSFIRPLGYKKNGGKGLAVRTGMLAAQGEFLIFADADDTFTSEHILAVAQKLVTGESVVIACREHSSGERLKGESRWRRWQGRIFRTMVHSLVLPGIKDSQCGLKGFSRQAAAELFSRQKIKGFGFDVELLALAQAQGFPIAEIPVKAVDCPGSRVNCLLTPLKMASELIRVKCFLATNSYRLPGVVNIFNRLYLPAGLFILALLARIPWLWEVPRYIDELREVNLAYLIYRGEALPLTNVARDIGALHNYILAGVFKLLGPSIYWPRFYVALTSAFTVVLVYFLGKKLYGHWTGLIAALLLLGNGMHILVTHMAWSNCTTPFFFSLAMLATLICQEKGSGKWLMFAAFLWGLTLQTHSSIIIYILVFIIYVFTPQFRQNNAIAWKYYLLAALSLMVAYSNMLYYNLFSKGGSFTWLKYKGYALEKDLSLSSYLHNLQEMLIELLRSLSSTYATHLNYFDYLEYPAFILVTIMLLVGSYWSLRGKKGLPVWIVAGSFLVMPWVNSRYVFFVATRYIMPIIICSFLLVAFGLFICVRSFYVWTGHKKYLLAPAGALIVLLAILQLLPFYGYCQQKSTTNQSNRLALQVLKKTLELASPNNTMVIIDSDLQLENDPLPYLLALGKQPYIMAAGKESRQYKASFTHFRRMLWSDLADKYKGKKLIAIMSAPTFDLMQPIMSPEEIDSFCCRIVFGPYPPGERRIYVVDLGTHLPDSPVFNSQLDQP